MDSALIERQPSLPGAFRLGGGDDDVVVDSNDDEDLYHNDTETHNNGRLGSSNHHHHFHYESTGDTSFPPPVPPPELLVTATLVVVDEDESNNDQPNLAPSLVVVAQPLSMTHHHPEEPTKQQHQHHDNRKYKCRNRLLVVLGILGVVALVVGTSLAVISNTHDPNEDEESSIDTADNEEPWTMPRNYSLHVPFAAVWGYNTSCQGWSQTNAPMMRLTCGPDPMIEAYSYSTTATMGALLVLDIQNGTCQRISDTEVQCWPDPLTASGQVAVLFQCSGDAPEALVAQSTIPSSTASVCSNSLSTSMGDGVPAVVGGTASTYTALSRFVCRNDNIMNPTRLESTKTCGQGKRLVVNVEADHSRFLLDNVNNHRFLRNGPQSNDRSDAQVVCLEADRCQTLDKCRGENCPTLSCDILVQSVQASVAPRWEPPPDGALCSNQQETSHDGLDELWRMVSRQMTIDRNQIEETMEGNGNQ